MVSHPSSKSPYRSHSQNADAKPVPKQPCYFPQQCRQIRQPIHTPDQNLCRVPSCCVVSSQSFPVKHDSPITNVDKHTVFLKLFVFLGHLGFQILDFFVLLRFHLCHILPCFCQFTSKVGTNSILGGLVRFAIDGGSILCQTSRYFLRVAINGGTGIVNISWKQVAIRILFLKNLQCFRYACT